MMKRVEPFVLIITLGAGMGCGWCDDARAQENPANVIAAHVRSQGHSCKNPEGAVRDASASKPDEAIWTLKCDGVTYRVRLTPDMADKVERLTD